MGREVTEQIQAFRFEVYIRVPTQAGELAYGEIAAFQDELASALDSEPCGNCVMSGYAEDWFFAYGNLPDLHLVKRGLDAMCKDHGAIWREMTPDSPTWPPEVAATLKDVEPEESDGD